MFTNMVRKHCFAVTGCRCLAVSLFRCHGCFAVSEFIQKFSLLSSCSETVAMNLMSSDFLNKNKRKYTPGF